MAYEIKELGVGEVLDHAILILKNRFGLLLRICTVGGYLPALLLNSFLTAYLAPPVWPFGATPEEMRAAQQAQVDSMPILGPLALLLGVVITPITYGAIIYAIAKEYLSESITVGQALRYGASRALTLIGLWILTSLALIGGSCLCVIPGILVFLKLFAAPEAVVIEGAGVSDALKRSWELTRGNLSKIFILMFLLATINVLAAGSSYFGPGPLFAAIVQTIVNVASFVFGTAAAVVLYFSFRCQKEHFDLVRLAAAMHRETDEPGTSAAY